MPNNPQPDYHTLYASIQAKIEELTTAKSKEPNDNEIDPIIQNLEKIHKKIADSYTKQKEADTEKEKIALSLTNDETIFLKSLGVLNQTEEERKEDDDRLQPTDPVSKGEEKEKLPENLSPEQLVALANNNYLLGKNTEAVRLYSLAAEQGDVAAQFNLGFCYKNGEGVKQDLTEAVRLYSLAAKQGNAAAQFNLGLCYEDGEGVERNLTEAARLYSLAAEQGDDAAQCNLGGCYEEGIGVERNTTEAVRLYSLAAEQGDALAQFHLGFCYEKGEGVEQDLTEAARLYSLAAAQGNASAQGVLKMIELRDQEEFPNIKKRIKNEIKVLIKGLSSEDFNNNANGFVAKVLHIKETLQLDNVQKTIGTINLENEFNAIALKALLKAGEKIKAKPGHQLLIEAANVLVQNFAADPSSVQKKAGGFLGSVGSFFQSLSPSTPQPNLVSQTLELHSKRDEVGQKIGAHLSDIPGLSNMVTEYLLGDAPSPAVRQAQAKDRGTRKLREDDKKEADKKGGGGRS